jgi:hypothetical protein
VTYHLNKVFRAIDEQKPLKKGFFCGSKCQSWEVLMELGSERQDFLKNLVSCLVQYNNLVQGIPSRDPP